MHGGLARAADTLGKRPAVRSADRSWTYPELDGWANALAHHLAGAGVGPGTRVALSMANRVEFVVAVHAVSKLGAASVLLSPAWKAAEVNAAVELTAPVHALSDADGLVLLAPRLGVDGVTDVDDPAAYAELLARSPRGRPARQI